MNPFHHALSSVRRFGGRAEDYLSLHQWFDASKAFMPDFRHRALRHHAEGIFLAETIFGPVIENSAGRKIPTRFLAEQHVKEDLARIPTVQDWLGRLRPEAWMWRGGTTSADLDNEDSTADADPPKRNEADASLLPFVGLCRDFAQAADEGRDCIGSLEMRTRFRELASRYRTLLLLAAEKGRLEHTAPCECEAPGYFSCGVPGVLAHFENGRLAPDTRVERCDLCRRFPSDEDARRKLVDAGLA